MFYASQDLSEKFPSLEEYGVDLLSVSLLFSLIQNYQLYSSFFFLFSNFESIKDRLKLFFFLTKFIGICCPKFWTFFFYWYIYFFHYQKLLCLDPKKRITAIDALKHEYFKDVQDWFFITSSSPMCLQSLLTDQTNKLLIHCSFSVTWKPFCWNSL